MAEAAPWHGAGPTCWLGLVRNVPSSWNVSTSSLEQKALGISLVLCNKRRQGKPVQLAGVFFCSRESGIRDLRVVLLALP